MPVKMFRATCGDLRRGLGAVIAAGFVVSHPVQAQQLPDRFGEQRVVGIVSEAPDGVSLVQAAASLGYTLDTETSLQGLDLLMYGFSIPSEVTPKQAIEALEAAVPASTVGINHAYRLQEASGAGYPLAYANELLHWEASACHAAGPVGVIDTGIDAEARAFGQTKIVSARFGKGTAAPTTHGTDVATLLSDPSRLRDVTIYGADVVSVVEGVGTAARAEALIEALNWLASENVRLVNVSLAGPYNKLLDVSVAAAQRHGMMLITSVGNAGPDSAPLYPAAFASSIAVTAVDANGQLYPKAVHGQQVDIAAPGVDIFVASKDGGHFVSGTSVATPFVTARILADPEWYAADSAAALRGLMAGSSRDLGAQGQDALFGIGLLQGIANCATQ